MPGLVLTPPGVLYRVAGRGRGLAFPPMDLPASGRFDDPTSPTGYRVLYTGERRACLFEKLAPFRPALSGMSTPPSDRWIHRHEVIEFSIEDPNEDYRWVDLRSPDTFAVLQVEPPRVLSEIRITIDPLDVDVSMVTGSNRPFTNAIGLWAVQHGYQGIRYTTRHTPDLSCWAIFDGVNLIIHSERGLTRDDLDLIAVANSWGIEH